MARMYMIEDLFRSFRPSAYKNLLIKSRINCLVFAIKVFLVTLFVVAIMNLPQLITTSYYIEDFTTGIESVEILVSYKNDSDEKFLNQKVEESEILKENIVEYDLEVFKGELQFNDYFLSDHGVYRNLKFDDAQAVNRFNNFLYSLYLILAPGILFLLSAQALIYVAFIIGITILALIFVSHYLYQVDFERAIKIPLLASPILSIWILINYIFRLHIINFAVFLYWLLVAFVIIELSTFKNEQRQKVKNYSERRKFLELNLTRYYDQEKISELEKNQSKWYNRLFNKFMKKYFEWRYENLVDEKWVDYSNNLEFPKARTESQSDEVTSEENEKSESK